MRPIVFILLAILACDAWTAQRIVMYRCTDAKGGVTLQNDVPCAKGSKQEKRVIEVPLPAPTSAPPSIRAAAPIAAPTPTPAAPAPAHAQKPDTTTTAVAERLPPPALYRCATYDKRSYLSDTDIHAPRCVPLQAVGLDGNPDSGAGVACEMLRDTCERIADDGLCEAWNQRLREAESALRFDEPERAEALRAEFNRAGKVVRESTCSKG